MRMNWDHYIEISWEGEVVRMMMRDAEQALTYSSTAAMFYGEDNVHVVQINNDKKLFRNNLEKDRSLVIRSQLNEVIWKMDGIKMENAE